MGVLRIPEAIWNEVNDHLAPWGEHFAFLKARHTVSNGEPVFWVTGVEVVPDSEVSVGAGGHELSLNALLGIINSAVAEGCALIEVHNHGGDHPRWSQVDRRGLNEVVPYMLTSLPGRPYAATVWAGGDVFGEWFMPGARGGLRSVTVVGKERFRQVVSRDDARAPETWFERQEPWFTTVGQRHLSQLRVAVVGNGGTGSPLVQNLAYLGIRDFVLVDPDSADSSSMNRVVTVRASDLGRMKTELAKRLILAVAPRANVTLLSCDLRSRESIEALRGCDLIFGCLDNDGGRLVLNELSLAYVVPYIDLAVGIEAENGLVAQVGGRVAFVIAGGPCLNCMGEIDPDEARYFLAPESQREATRRLGYVHGMDVPAPSVVSITAAIAAAAINELAVWFSGIRPLNFFTELDVLGIGRGRSSQWLTPRRVRKDPDCVTCAQAAQGDQVELERYEAALQDEGIS